MKSKRCLSCCGAPDHSSIRLMQFSRGKNWICAIFLKSLPNLCFILNLRWKLLFRWSQGFVFSEYEPSALVQMQGGKCDFFPGVFQYFAEKIWCHLKCMLVCNWYFLASLKEHFLDIIWSKFFNEPWLTENFRLMFN